MLSSENQLFIRCATTPWYKYIVEFSTVIPSRTTRFHIMNHLSATLGDSKMLYDGQFLYAPHPLAKEVVFPFFVREKNVSFLD